MGWGGARHFTCTPVEDRGKHSTASGASSGAKIFIKVSYKKRTVWEVTWILIINNEQSEMITLYPKIQVNYLSWQRTVTLGVVNSKPMS